jgi:DNA-binding transcriptional LysR family regulator
MDRLECMQTFCRVAELNSFSGAARLLELSPAVVTRQVAALEEMLGTRLLNRSTRHVSLSEAGQQYYQECVDLLEQFEALEARAVGHAERATGLLRITAPLDFGRMYLRTAVREFLSLEPEVRVEVYFEDRLADLLDERFDMSLRIGRLPDSNLVVRKLGEVCIGCFASPDYLAANGEPGQPSDLAEHQVLEYSLSPTPGKWQFHQGRKVESASVQWRFASNNGRALADAACEGLGIVRLPEFLVADHLGNGRLIEVLSGHRSAPLDISILYLHRRLNPAKVRLFAEFLVGHFENKWTCRD